MSNGIRGYGPGKFNTILDSLVYDMIGQGMGGQSCGDVSEVGFFAESILLGPDAVEDVEAAAKDDQKARGVLTEQEADLVKNSYGAIMAENEQGFVSVDYYETKKEFESDWAEIEADATPEDEDEGEEEEAETESAQEEGE